MSECYVCYEPCTDHAPCKCKTLFVHPSCILIMQLYGQKECGVCKTPYVEPQTEIVEEEWNPPPCWCLCIPTPLRSHVYDTNEVDSAFDIVRYVFIGIQILVIVHILSQPNTPFDFSKDWPALVLTSIFLIVACNLAAQRLRRPPHSVHLHIHRDSEDP